MQDRAAARDHICAMQAMAFKIACNKGGRNSNTGKRDGNCWVWRLMRAFFSEGAHSLCTRAACVCALHVLRQPLTQRSSLTQNTGRIEVGSRYADYAKLPCTAAALQCSHLINCTAHHHNYCVGNGEVIFFLLLGCFENQASVQQ